MRDESENAEPGPEVTPELFQAWRSPRFGTANPERMNNPVWEWLIRSKKSAYAANEKFNGPSPFDAGPTWCFDRFGQSATKLPDGRELFVGGEHEDSYDPDFNIYNDVVALHPDGKLDIFGYPIEDFEPTDFHSATLVDNRVIIIGCLGYSGKRRFGTTPISILDLATFAISPVESSGACPGWLHRHTATLDSENGAIIIRGGKVDRWSESKILVENIDDWRLDLTNWQWKRLTDRQWNRWDIRRADGHGNHVWSYQQALFCREVNWSEELQRDIGRLTEQLGKNPDLDLAAKLFSPPLAYVEGEKREDEYNIVRINVDGVVVRYVYDGRSLQVTVEGNLPSSVTETIVGDVREKLEALENATVITEEL